MDRIPVAGRWLACLAGVLLASLAVVHADEPAPPPVPTRQQQIADIERQLAELAGKLDELKKANAPKAATPAPPKAVAKADPVAATGRLTMPLTDEPDKSKVGTATVIFPRRADGKWDILTADHCVDGTAGTGTLTLRDGRAIKVKAAAQAPYPTDLAWMVTEADDLDLPFARLAEKDAAAGTPCWEDGYGVDRDPGVVRGTVVGGPAANGQMCVDMTFGHGDSGGGIFDTKTGELIAVVSCHRDTPTPIGVVRSFWGGAVSVARKIRP